MRRPGIVGIININLIGGLLANRAMVGLFRIKFSYFNTSMKIHGILFKSLIAKFAM